MPKRLVVVVPSVMRRLEDWSDADRAGPGARRVRRGRGGLVPAGPPRDAVHPSLRDLSRGDRGCRDPPARAEPGAVRGRRPGRAQPRRDARPLRLRPGPASRCRRAQPAVALARHADRAVRQPQPRHGGQPAPALVAAAGVLVRAGAAVGSRVPAARPAARLRVRQLAADRVDPDHVVGSCGAARRAAPRHRGRPGDGAGEHRHRDLPHRTDGVAAGRHPRRPGAPGVGVRPRRPVRPDQAGVRRPRAGSGTGRRPGPADRAAAARHPGQQRGLGGGPA